MPWFAYIALKQLFPSGRFFSFYALVSILGVTVGVMVIIVVQAVMSGYGKEIKASVIEYQGAIRIQKPGSIIYDGEQVLAVARADPAVAAATPYAEGVVLLQHQQQPVFPGIRGIDVNTEASVIPLDEHLIRGDVEDLDDYTVFLGASMARSIGADMGDAVEIYTPLMLERIKEDAILLPRELEVAGIIETGRHEIDARAVIVTIRLMQELYALGDGIHGVALRLEKNAPPAQVVADRLNQNLAGENRALPWYQLNREFLFIIGLERTMSLFVTIVILLVATFSITVSLMMSVIRKTREIGLLVAMGGRPREVAWSYTLQGFFIGISGSITGLLLAMFLLNFRVPIMNAFMMLTNSRDAVLQAYGFANLPIHYNASQIIFALVFAVILSTLAGLLPAWRASRLKPADALRSD